MKINVGQKEIIHFTGIGGIGMSGLAQVMKVMGFKVQGSDININKNVENCKKLGIKFYIGQKKKNIRLLHLIMISIVTLETCIGVACPLTIIENNLRGIYVSNSFVDSFFNKILYVRNRLKTISC